MKRILLPIIFLSVRGVDVKLPRPVTTEQGGAIERGPDGSHLGEELVNREEHTLSRND